MTESADTGLEERVRSEIEALHRVIDRWIRGETPNNAGFFEDNFASRFVAGFVNIQPAGKVLSRSDLLSDIRGTQRSGLKSVMYGSSLSRAQTTSW